MAGKSPHLLTALLLTLCLLSPVRGEEFYRWQDDNGQTHFGDIPPPQAKNARAITLRLQSPLYEVTRVIDGDTIIVSNGGKVRLLGINAPEIAHRDRAGETLGNEAQQRLKQLLKGKRVRLEFDQQRRDRFKRLLAHVTLEDGTNINEQLLHDGLARALFLQPNMRHLQRYYEAERVAQQEQRGIWTLPEYQLLPAGRAKQCIKRFCRLSGKVLAVEKKRELTHLRIKGGLQVTLHNKYLEQFEREGIDVSSLVTHNIMVRGWVGSRHSQPTLHLQHPRQIRLLQ